MTEAGLAIFVLAAFVIPVPLLAWLDRALDVDAVQPFKTSAASQPWK